MAWQDNPIIKSHDGSFYIVTATAGSFPYSVVPVADDPGNKYDFEEVAKFWKELPDDDARKLTGDSPPAGPDPPTDAEIMAGYKSQIPARLNTAASARGYESVLDCVSYYHSEVQRRLKDAAYMITLRDATYAAWDIIAAAVAEETQPVPSSWTVVESKLPAISWPEA